MRHGPRNINVCFINPDDVYGLTEEEMVGFSLGKIANLAFNPIAQTRALLSAGRGAGSAVARAAGFGAAPQLPPAPNLRPGMAQAGASAGSNTIHAYMGLGAAFWFEIDGAPKPFNAEPQAPFIGKRLIIAQSGTVPRLVTLSAPLTVSGMPQTPAPAQAAPVEMFAANATYAALDLQIATSGTQITMTLSISAAPGAAASGARVDVSAGLYGEWIR